ncbi:MAG: hypothetical protein WBR26_15775 [Candidatus Acidiferrum sp.]
MNGKNRPISVTIVASVYIAVGVLGFAFHLREILAQHALHYDGLLTELIELVSLVAGIFLLRGQNWARWVALLWIGFHVVLSAFHAFHEFAIHAVICVLITWALFHPEATRYFRGSRAEPISGDS